MTTHFQEIVMLLYLLKIQQKFM